MDLDIKTIQKFGTLGLSPPTEVDQIEELDKQLKQLRDALKLKGEIEQAEGKAKILKDNSYVESERYEDVKKNFTELEGSVRS